AIMAAEHNLKKVVLYDTQQDVAERLAKKLRENVGNQNPNIEILVKQEPEEAFGEARIWVTTAGVPKPVIINPDCLLRGTFGVDDGQPHNVSPEVAHSQNTAFCEPLAKPIAYRTFPTGLVQKGGVDAASYGCETQAVVAQRLKRMGVNLADCLSMGPGKVTPERVKEIYQLIEKSGIDLQLAPLQSHGRLLTPEHFKTVARHWQQ
ncbi:hypothetical protein KKD61_00840, partial [Patescibacteria group bacterium]|nr:hypothetical protein [Patescibacteria group bacterium]